MYEDFPEGQPGPQDAIANPQTHEAQDAGLRIVKPTDLRDFEGWSNDEAVCQRFLTDRPREWRTAIQRYWRERCTRRDLANELGLPLETVKNLLRRIRKAAKDDGKQKRKHTIETQWPRRPHSEINQQDILAICDGDYEAREHAEEYRRLTTISQLKLFGEISGPLVEILNQSNALGTTTIEAAAHLIAEADELKASVAKDDPFVGRPLIQSFIGRQANYHGDGRGRPRKIGPDVSDLRIMPIPSSIFLDGRVSQF